MKYFKILFIGCITLLSCNKEADIDYVIISGKIDNPGSNEIQIHNYRGLYPYETNKKIEIDNEGFFRDTLTGLSGYYNFAYGNRSFSAFLKPGFDIEIKFDSNTFPNNVIIEGYGAMHNNYLIAKKSNTDALNNSDNELYTLEEKPFKEKIKIIEASNLNYLYSQTNLDKSFIDIEVQNIKYDTYYFLMRYKQIKEYSGIEFSKDYFTEEFKDIYINNAEHYAMYTNYQLAANSHFFSKYLFMDRVYSNGALNKVTEETFSIVDTLSVEALKNDLLTGYTWYLLSPRNENIHTTYDLINSRLTNQKYAESLNELYDKIKVIARGEKSPEFFDYENYKGGTTSLSDFKGKYVYIDFWATWCKPCIKEIPYLKKLETKYHGKNIEFVSISVDALKDYDKWKNMVNEKNLGGVQLFADNSTQSSFYVDFVDSGIPRFILIDPEGIIISPGAPNPSHSRLITLFNELGI